MHSPARRFWSIVLLLAVVLYAGCSEEARITQPEPAVPQSIALKAIPSGYYDSVDATTPAAMRTTLHAVIDDNIKIPYTSTAIDTWNVLESADQDPNDSGRILDVYMNASYPKYGEGNLDYNREHIWAKSYGFPIDGASNYPYTDCHHLFLCNDSYNTSRSNKPFGTSDASALEKPTEVNDGMGGGTGVYPGNSNWTSGSLTDGIWETWIGRRGDVARALFYMDVRYEGGTHGVTGYSEPDLILTDNLALIEASNTGSNESIGYMGLLSVLLQWHVQDPVDDRERARNEAVYSYQGNRNPFIDNPDWVDCIFNGDCSGGGGSGGGAAWINEFHYDNDGTDTGEFFEIAGAAGTSLSGWSVIGYNGSGGVVYATIALSGTLPDQQAGFGTLAFNMVGMQNGSPDGLALVDAGGGVIEFISYEGAFTATDGPAAGLLATDVGVTETTTTTIGYSLQLGGSGTTAADFSWQSPAANTAGAVNTGQTFSGGATNQAPTAEANGPYSAGVGATVTLSSSGSYDPDGTIASWYWTFGDGGSSTQTNPGHVYTSTGSFNITLTVTDNLGATGYDTATATISDTTPPAAPTGLSASAGDGSVTLDWANNGESDLAGYTVYRSTGSGGPYTALNGILLGVSAYTDTAVDNGTTYYYVVTADDNTGNESGYSSQASATPAASGGSGDGTVWINEFHYDNDGTDSGEFFEIAGPAGTSLAGWTVVGYNGGDNSVYDTEYLGGTLPDTQGGYGVLSFNMVGMQNGSPDGLALVDNTGTVYQFISYEGVITALNGPAAGWTSTDIGVSEPSTTTPGYSLQLAGSGTVYGDFSWQAPASGTPGAVNTGQTLGDGSGGGGWVVISYDDFESGWGSYTEGGVDCLRYTGGTMAHQGAAALDIQDNSGTASSFYHTGSYDVSGYADLEVEFWFYAYSMDKAEDFWVQYFDGSTWRTVATFTVSIDFVNSQFYNEVVSIPAGSYAYPANAKLRFVCDASNDADDVYIDEITFRGYQD